MTKQLHFLGFSLNKCFLRTVKGDGDIIKVQKKCSKRLSGKAGECPRGEVVLRKVFEATIHS